MPSSAASNAGLRCGAGHHHDDAGLTDLHRAQPVHHGDAADGVLAGDLAPDFRHFADRHRFVAFVFEPLASPGLWYCYGPRPGKLQWRRHNPAITWFRAHADRSDRASGRKNALRDRRFRARSDPPLTGGSSATSSPSAERFASGGELLVAREHDARSHLRAASETRGVVIENGARRSRRAGVRDGPRRPADVFQKPEKKNPDLHYGKVIKSGCLQSARLQSITVSPHLTSIRVRYAETDQMGIVYYANYLVWMEVARVDYCRAIGFHYKDMELDDGILWPWPNRIAATSARPASTKRSRS